MRSRTPTRADGRLSPGGAMPELEHLPLNDAPDSAARDFERAHSGREAATSAAFSVAAGPGEPAKRPHHPEPSARWYHAAFHTVTAMVGAGVLALPYSFSYLTWGGGLACLALATAVSLYCSHILADMHELPDHPRMNRYRDLGRAVLGPRAGTWAIMPLQFAVCVGLDIAYTLTAGQSLQAVQNPACNAHTVAKTAAHAEHDCSVALNWWIAGFAALQMGLSQLRDFHSLWWVSLIGALMSALYSCIAFGASLLAIKPGVDHSMRPGSPADRLFGVLNAVGTILFAFGGQSVQLEIQALTQQYWQAQATLAKPPSPYTAMMRGIYLAYVLIICAYFGVSIAGYAAFGSATNPDILLSITEPGWLIKAANLMVVVHVAASFQLFAHPVFEAAEQSLARLPACARRPPSSSPHQSGAAAEASEPHAQLPLAPRAAWRCCYCAFCAAITIVLPFFNDVIGIVGSAGFVPMSYIFPCLFYILTRRYRNRAELWLNWGIIGVFGTAGLFAVVASARNLVVRAERYHSR